MSKVYYCKETGEDMKPNGDCLIHGKQPMSHFEEETNDIKKCEVCGNGFFCMDHVRTCCSLRCAGAKHNA